jgi:hypothetical protein
MISVVIFVVTDIRQENGIVTVAAVEWDLQIEILGRADFDGDGREDLLVQTFEDYRLDLYGNWPHLFLMLRAGPDAPIRIVWEYGVTELMYSVCRKTGVLFEKPE